MIANRFTGTTSWTNMGTHIKPFKYQRCVIFYLHINILINKRNIFFTLKYFHLINYWKNNDTLDAIQCIVVSTNICTFCSLSLRTFSYNLREIFVFHRLPLLSILTHHVCSRRQGFIANTHKKDASYTSFAISPRACFFPFCNMILHA